MLLNNLNLSTSYNLDADGVTNLAPRGKRWYTIIWKQNECEFWDHSRSYAIDNTGNRINTFNINNGGSLLEWLAQIWLWTIPFRVVQKIKIVKIKFTNNQKWRTEDDLFGTNTDLNNNRKVNLMAAKKKVLMLFQNFSILNCLDMTFAYSLTYGNNNKRKANYRKFINDFTNADLTQNGKQVFQLVWFCSKWSHLTQLRFERD
jgi:hypothetical protein